MGDNRAQDIIVLYNLLRQEIGAIEMALEAVRAYVKGEGRDDSVVREALTRVEDMLVEINDSVGLVLRVYTKSKGER